MTWENFSREEFECTCGCGTNLIEDSFIDRLQTIRSLCDFPMPVTSGYRCPDHPAERRKERPGAHAQGRAADIGVSGAKAIRLVQVALANGITGLGVNQKGNARFIHLDDLSDSVDRPRPWVWSY